MTTQNEYIDSIPHAIPELFRVRVVAGLLFTKMDIHAGSEGSFNLKATLDKSNHRNANDHEPPAHHHYWAIRQIFVAGSSTKRMLRSRALRLPKKEIRIVFT